MGEVTVGVVLPRTGRLRELSDPLEFALDSLRQHTEFEVVAADSRSNPAAAQAAVRELGRQGVSLVLTLGGTHTLPAVAAACEAFAVPGLSTTLPWQVYRARRDVADPVWSFHFCWGLDDIAGAFADMWDGVTEHATVGCLWNDGVQGTALRDPANGFGPTAAGRGHRLVDPGGYVELNSAFDRHVDRFLAERVQVVTAAADARDLAAFAATAGQRGLRPRLITCSRWLSYPFGAERAGLDGVGTIVAWTPRHPHRSSLDGRSAAELAAAYERATSKPWLQPLGLAHALVEVAVHALRSADDPRDRHAVAAALRRVRLDTICGTLDWTAGPAPSIARVPLTGGRWIRDHGRMRLET
ncbi:hypothetical protein GCM10022267_85570 [Lentzea roselyniae]|uniref:Leucine-binding protein domain-containing protein n=1 Tax=Lentzea roselyniae TaxID=531940 RepID=A0ABP7CDT6_9PSEU